jgi:putative DNA primase/helicase
VETYDARTEAWPKPEPLGDDLLPVPEFDPALLPAAFREHVCDVAERMQVPLDLPAVCAVACLAGVVNRRVTIQPKRADTGWVVIPNLWSAIVTPPGRLKSPTLAAFTRHLARIEARWRVEHESELEEYQLWERERALRERVWEQEFVRATKKGVSPPIRPDDTRTKPIQRRLITNDPTYEALQLILAQNPAGLLLERDELSGWLATLDKPGREGERQFFLALWAGDKSYAVDRIGRGNVHAQALCLSIVGGIQPGRLRQYLAETIKGGPGDDGLFQRFQLLAWPNFPKDWTLVDRPPNQQAAERVAQVYGQLAELPGDEPTCFRFADEAQELFFMWWSELERNKIIPGDLHPALTAHLAKYRSLIPSLAVLFELADSDCPGQATVSLPHARQAAAWCAYLESHARRVYGCLISPEVHAARVLAMRLVRLPGEFSTRDVYLKHWESLSTPEEARAALGVLEDAYWVRRVLGNDFGRPSERWLTNPRIREEVGERD